MPEGHMILKDERDTAMSGTFFAAASLIERRAHLAETIEDETEAIAAALRARASIAGEGLTNV